MKADGIVRRFDDLGRIVIPKEIRMQLFGTKCTYGEAMEIFIDGENIILRKYEENTKLCGYSKEDIELNRNAMYNKAIDDFVKFASDMPTVETEDGEIRPMWLEEMAEQLKAGESDGNG